MGTEYQVLSTEFIKVSFMHHNLAGYSCSKPSHYDPNLIMTSSLPVLQVIGWAVKFK